jgi:hypothetical protein
LNVEQFSGPSELPDSYQGHNMVFIVGCPRSGTTWLQSLVRSNPMVHSGPESHVFQWYLGPLLRKWNSELVDRDTGMGNYLQEEEFQSILRRFMLQILAPMASKLKDGELFVDKTPGNGIFMKEISELLPESKVVHMLRDGRDVTASLMDASKGWAKAWAPNDCSGAAKMWVKSVTAVHNSAKTYHAELFHEVRYEALWTDPQRTLGDLIRFLGLDWDEQNMRDAIRRNDARSPSGQRTNLDQGGAYAEKGAQQVNHNDFIKKPAPGRWKSDLSLIDKIRFWSIARKTMEEMGYKCPYPW